MNRTTRSLWNFSSSALFTLVTLLLALVTTPMLVRFLGDDRYGASRALLDWFGYIGLLELGIGTAMLPLIARRLGAGQNNEVHSVISAGARAYHRIAVIMLLAAVVAAVSAPWLVPVGSALRAEIWLAAGLYVAAVPFIVLSPIRQFLEASQKGYIVSCCLILQSMVLTLCWVLLAWSGLGIASQAAATLIASIIMHATLMVLMCKRRRDIVFRVFRPEAESGADRELWRLNWKAFVVNTASRASLLSDNIVIGLILSPAAVTPFVLTQRLAQIAQGQLQNIGSSGWAALVELVHRGEHDAMKTRFLELTRATTALGAAALAPIIAYNASFVALWVGLDRYAGHWLTSIAAINALIWSIASLWGWLFSGTERIGLLVTPTVCGAAMNIAVSLGITFFGSRAGWGAAILGPVIGTFASLALINLPFLAIMLRKEFAIPLRKLALAVFSPIAWLALPIATVVWLAAEFPPRSWISLAGSMAGSATLLLGTVWVAVLSAKERSVWRARLSVAFTSRTGAASDR